MWFVNDSEENVERDAVHKALMSLLRQDVKGKIYNVHLVSCVRISIVVHDRLPLSVGSFISGEESLEACVIILWLYVSKF